MTKIVLVSDNHYNIQNLKYILENESDADLYLHCGDSEMFQDEIKPFASVLGNNDYDRSYPKERSLEIDGLKILMLHGNPYVSVFSDKELVAKAKKGNYDLVFFGHTHVFSDFTKLGIRFINPGSSNYNRDGTLPSYAIIEINNQQVNVKRVDIKY